MDVLNQFPVDEHGDRITPAATDPDYAARIAHFVTVEKAVEMYERDRVPIVVSGDHLVQAGRSLADV